MKKLYYKGFEIEATPYQLADTGLWTTHIYIWKHRGQGSTNKEFSATYPFGGRDEAIKDCLNFGKQIINGQFEGCSVKDL